MFEGRSSYLKLVAMNREPMPRWRFYALRLLHFVGFVALRAIGLALLMAAWGGYETTKDRISHGLETSSLSSLMLYVLFLMGIGGVMQYLDNLGEENLPEELQHVYVGVFAVVAPISAFLIIYGVAYCVTFTMLTFLSSTD